MLQKLKKSAFWRCFNLEKIELSKQVNYIGDGAFEDCFQLKEIVISEENSYYTFCDGTLVEKSK